MTIVRRAFRQLTLLVVLMLLVIAVIKMAPTLWRRLYPIEHQHLISREAKLRQVDPNLVAAVINVESHWRASAVSPKGASGLMQLMPGTAAWAAEKAGISSFEQQDLFKPEVNIQLGTWYLSNLLQVFKQNLPMALAAYNGGQGNVESWLQSGTWDGTLEQVNSIPFGETRRYVQKVLKQYEIYGRLYQWQNEN